VAKLDSKLLEEEKMLVDISEVRFVTWNPDKGELLRQLRGKKSRRQLAEEIKAVNGDCSHQNLKKLEYGHSEMVSIEILESLCLALGVALDKFIALYSLRLPSVTKKIAKGG
jgi:transcriptional regulator with XRE-family HTH domain